MFWNKKTEDKDLQTRLLKFSDDIAELTQQLKHVRDDLDKMEIKVLESRKIYQRKLQRLCNEETEEKQEDKEMDVFLR